MRKESIASINMFICILLTKIEKKELSFFQCDINSLKRKNSNELFAPVTSCS